MLRSTLKLQQFKMLTVLMLISLIVLQTGEAQVATANINHEHADQKQQHQQQHQQQQQQQRNYPQHHRNQNDAEPRQFGIGNGVGDFNANAAFNSNFGSSSFGLNHSGLNINQFNSGSYRPTTAAPQTLPSFSTPSSFNSINAIKNQDSHKKEPNKNAYNDAYNQKHPGTRVIDRFNHHYPDGSYEYRYELGDGTARYERGYFLMYDNKKTLVVVGYYSYRMSDGRYITVFYNADQNGYRQNQSITPQNYPNLPRSIDVPQFKNAEENLYARETTTLNPRLTTATTKRSGRF